MKKNYTILLIYFFALLNASAQTIASFTVVPTNPTSVDTITVYIQCDFPNSDCYGDSYFNGINGNEISAGGLHCMGSLSTLCTDFDTIKISPLAAGQYVFVFILSTGTTVGCIPGIVPLVIDSTHITVSSATGINDFGIQNNVLQIIPNPSSGNFIVKQNAGEISALKIFSPEGSLVKSYLVTGSETTINCSLPPGIYTLVSECKNTRVFSKLVLIN